WGRTLPIGVSVWVDRHEADVVCVDAALDQRVDVLGGDEVLYNRNRVALDNRVFVDGPHGGRIAVDDEPLPLASQQEKARIRLAVVLGAQFDQNSKPDGRKPRPEL